MIDNGGHSLAFYVTQGTGPTIVLDSGGGEDTSYWKDLVPGAARGHGRHRHHLRPVRARQERRGARRAGRSRVLSAISRPACEQLGVTEDVTLVSHSQAGQIATYLAQDNPTLLSGAVLVTPTCPPFFTDEQIARLVAFSQPQGRGGEGGP